jgi:phage-related protein
MQASLKDMSGQISDGLSKLSVALDTFGNKADSAFHTAGQASKDMAADSENALGRQSAVAARLMDLAKQVQDATAIKGFDAKPFWDQIATLRTEVSALSPLNLNVDADTTSALAKIEALKTEISLSSVDLTGRNSAIDALSKAGKGGGGRGKGLLGLLGWGGGALGMAGIGTPLGLGGLGFEHVLMTMLGLGGFAAAGAAGGGLLAAGAIGTGVVGMGTDMAGSYQAISEVKQIVPLLTQYSDVQQRASEMIQLYGKNSTQAVAAMRQVQTAQLNINDQLSNFPTQAQNSILQAAQSWETMKQLFISSTGAATNTGAQLIKQVFNMASTYIPVIGQFAAQNMKIIQSGLQPFFAWMKGPGLKIFTDLEGVFQDSLPGSVHTFTQAIEVLFHAIDTAAHYTGGFMNFLDQLFSKMNTPGGLAKMDAMIGRLIGDFRILTALLKIAFKDIVDLFKSDPGTGKAIVQTITEMLTKLNAWETSVKGKGQLANLFTVHKKETLELLQLLPTLIGSFGKLEMTAGPAMTNIVNAVLQIVNDLLKIPDVGKLAGIALAVGLLASKFKLFEIASTSFKGIQTGFAAITEIGKAMHGLATGTGVVDTLKGLAGGLKNIGKAGPEAAAGETEAAAGAGVLDVALGLLMTVGIMAVIAGLYLLVTHWKLVWSTVKQVFDNVWQFIKQYSNYIALALIVLLGPIGILIAAVMEMATHWKESSQYIMDAWHALVDYFMAAWAIIVTLFKVQLAVVTTMLKVSWDTIKAIVTVVWDAIKTYFEVWWNLTIGIIKVAWAIISGIFNVFLDVIQGKWGAAWKAIQTMFSNVWNIIKGTAATIWGDISGFFAGAWSTFDTWASGVWKSIVSGITAAWDALRTGAKSVWDDVSNFFVNGANAVIGIINTFIRVIDAALSVLGIPKIPQIPTIGGNSGGRGGTTGATESLLSKTGAAGAALAAGGMITSGPTYLVGEGDPRYPEAVIPTDPKYRNHALELLKWTTTALGGGVGSIPGMLINIGQTAFKKGGLLGIVSSVVSSVTSGIRSVLGGAAAAALDPAKGIADAAASALGSPWSNIGHTLVADIYNGIVNFVKGHHGSGKALSASLIPSGAHLSLIAQALQMAGVAVNPNNEAAVNLIVGHESGWNANAINLWDSNAAAGDPSRGLMQTIMSTFMQYAIPGYNANIYDPLSNLIAGIRYAVSRYGSLGNVPGVKAVAGGGNYVGYDSGGWLMPGLTMAYNGTGRPEPVGGGLGGAPDVTVNYAPVFQIHGGSSDEVLNAVQRLIDNSYKELTSQLVSRYMPA